MQIRKRYPIVHIFNIALFFLVFLLHYNPHINISIKTATPLVLLPLIIAFSIFNSPLCSFAFGLVTGICMDAVAIGAICFNAIVIMLIAVFVSICSKSLFNRNIWAALILSIICAMLYFTLRWALFYAFSVGSHDSLAYLLGYAVPSAVYTGIFIVPFYFLYRFIDSKINP